MENIVCGLMNGEYSIEPNDTMPISNEEQAGHVKAENGIKPVMFKNLIGRGHPEFSGKQQQDAQEFFLHLLTVIAQEFFSPSTDSNGTRKQETRTNESCIFLTSIQGRGQIRMWSNQAGVLQQ